MNDRLHAGMREASLIADAGFGEQVPVPVTTFAPIATGGQPQQPITSFNYQNIGVNIDITPRTHHDDDVTLLLKIAVTSISGVGFGQLPTIGNREISTHTSTRLLKPNWNQKPMSGTIARIGIVCSTTAHG